MHFDAYYCMRMHIHAYPCVRVRIDAYLFFLFDAFATCLRTSNKISGAVLTWYIGAKEQGTGTVLGAKSAGAVPTWHIGDRNRVACAVRLTDGRKRGTVL
jgi:hypothetical protein